MSDVYSRNSDEKHVPGDTYVGEPVEYKEEETHRALKPRQISMIAIGGAIGVLFFLSPVCLSSCLLVSLSAYLLGLVVHQPTARSSQ